jgi:hypothetical protein
VPESHDICVRHLGLLCHWPNCEAVEVLMMLNIVSVKEHFGYYFDHFATATKTFEGTS